MCFAFRVESWSATVWYHDFHGLELGIRDALHQKWSYLYPLLMGFVFIHRFGE